MFAQRPIDLVTVAGPAIGPEDDWQAHLRLVAGSQHSVAERLRDGGRAPREVLLSGRPASEIVEQAKVSGADLIVLGAHGQTSLDRLLLGSTTLEVLTHSSASVLVAREPVFGSADLVRTIPAGSLEPGAFADSIPV
jgi:nucleotide-binding universal stress UspA family protein